jgi:hypothetical protein
MPFSQEPSGGAWLAIDQQPRDADGSGGEADGAEMSFCFGARLRSYFITGMTNSAPERIPVGQREVMVFSLV